MKHYLIHTKYTIARRLPGHKPLVVRRLAVIDAPSRALALGRAMAGVRKRAARADFERVGPDCGATILAEFDVDFDPALHAGDSLAERDASALDAIARIMSANEWGADLFEPIRDEILTTGRTITEVDEFEDDEDGVES